MTLSRFLFAALLCGVALVTGCRFGASPEPLSVEEGIASFYTVENNGGTETASGEPLEDTSFTAAHRTLPFGTIVRVVNLKNEKTTQVRITDRGPFIEGRIIDLSLAGGRALEMTDDGIVPVRVEVLP